MPAAMSRVMFDTETLDTRSTAVILSVAAVEFDGNCIGRKFHEFINIDSCLDKGLTIGGNTLSWWMDQPAKAREIFRRTTKPLDEVLLLLATWLDWGKVDEVWANGTDFDFPILDNAYRACGAGSTPWAYFKSRDYRTVRKMYPRELVNDLTIEPEVEHDALSDALAQTYTLQALLASGNSFRSMAA